MSNRGSVLIGKYALEVGAYPGSLAQFASTSTRADRVRARRNAAALREALAQPDERLGLLEAVEKVEDTADEVTRRIEHANRLLKAVAEDRLLDRNLLTGEIGALLGLLNRLDHQGRYEEEIRVAKALHGLCVLAFRWLDLVRSLRSGLAAARAIGDEKAQAWALNELGVLHLGAGKPQTAVRHLEDALELREKLGEAAGRCATRHNLDNARRDRARPVQVGAPRRLIALGAVGALAIFGFGGTALGLLLGGSVAEAARVADVTRTVEIEGDGDEPVSELVTLVVGRDGDGDGSVSGPGIACGVDCSEDLAAGALVTLEAVAEKGSRFVGWKGIACREETCALRLEDDLTAIAVFEREPVTLAVEIEGDGSVSGNGIVCGTDCSEEVAAGARIRLEAVAEEGSRFVGWDGVACKDGPSEGTCILRAEDDLTAVAVFEPEPVTLAVVVDGDGDGSVSGLGVACGVDCSEEVAAGTLVTLEAVAEKGSRFVGWKGIACDGGNQQETVCTFTAASDAQILAAFEPEDPFGRGGVE